MRIIWKSILRLNPLTAFTELRPAVVPGLSALILGSLILPVTAQTTDVDIRTGIAGHWVINDDLSQNTDEQVEAAIKAAGGKVQRRRWFSKPEEDRYRGGPADQELYDRISYDDVLTVSYNDPEFRFEYADNYLRIFHSDGRRRTTAVNDYFELGGEDFSFANFDSNSLIVEARPRDGGFTTEVYTLTDGGNRLQVEMTIEPLSFRSTITLTRVYDRAAVTTNQ